MEAPPAPPSPAGVPADVKTWAEFNTWFALNNQDSRLKDFSNAWTAHREYLATVKKPRKPRTPKPKETVESLTEDVAKPKKRAARKKVVE